MTDMMRESDGSDSIPVGESMKRPHSPIQFRMKYLLKILDYVRKDQLRRLRKYVGKRDIDLNTMRTPASANLLHVAAEMSANECAGYLLDKYPDMAAETDINGNTPLLLTLRSALHGGSFSGSLIELLRDHPSYEGVQAKEAQSLYRSYQAMWEKNAVDPEEGSLDTAHAEDDFEERLARHHETDLEESLGFGGVFSSWTSGSNTTGCSTTPESFETWADRILNEFKLKREQEQAQVYSSWQQERKRRQAEAVEANKPKLTALPPPPLHKKLRKYGPHMGSISRKEHHFRSLEEHVQAMKDIIEKQQSVTFDTFPWPGSAPGDVNRIVEELLANGSGDLECQSARREATKRHARGLLLIWHPDKMGQKFGSLFESDKDRDDVIAIATEVAKKLNAAMKDGIVPV